VHGVVCLVLVGYGVAYLQTESRADREVLWSLLMASAAVAANLPSRGAQRVELLVQRWRKGRRWHAQRVRDAEARQRRTVATNLIHTFLLTAVVVALALGAGGEVASSPWRTALYAVALVMLLSALARAVVEVRRSGPAPYVPRRARRAATTPS
jgi:hypothetical protein